MTGMIGTAARWLAGMIVALFAAPLLAALVGAGIDVETADGFVQRTSEFIEMAIFIGLLFGTTKGLTFFKGIDAGAFAQRVWQKEVGRQIADIPAPDAKEAIETQQANVSTTKYRV